MREKQSLSIYSEGKEKKKEKPSKHMLNHTSVQGGEHYL